MRSTRLASRRREAHGEPGPGALAVRRLTARRTPHARVVQRQLGIVLLHNLHTGFIAFVVLGLVLVLIGMAIGWRWTRNAWFRVAHLAAIAFVVVVKLKRGSGGKHLRED